MFRAVVAVTFQPRGRLYYFDPAGLELAYGQDVLVPTAEGAEVAQVAWGPAHTEWAGELEPIVGLADAASLSRDVGNRARRAEIAAVARALIAEHELQMRLVGVDFVDQSDQFDQQAVIYYEATTRVDFRGLLTDLARALRSRIDLRQIGARDAAAILGGLGSCGRECCCSLMGPPREPMSIRMARNQELHGQQQVLGVCGRLMCCLSYENELYLEYRKRAPAIGDRVETPHGAGVVVAHDVPREAVVVRRGTERFSCPLGKVCPARRVPQARVRPGPSAPDGVGEGREDG